MEKGPELRLVGKWAARILVLLILSLGGLWLFAPREPVEARIIFDPNALGGDLDAYLAAQEARFPDITPGAEKRILWAGDKGKRTPVALVYLHGFSATSEEIRPVPDRVAQAMAANLFYTRLAGHGRGADAMAEPSAGDWINDTAEALAIGRAIGDEVIVLSTSTGGTLAAIAATDPALMERVRGIAFISPNFGLNSAAAMILTWPLARYWVPVVVGKEVSYPPLNAHQAMFWTTRYPTTALLPMAALVDYALGLEYSKATVPALFYYAPADQVVAPSATEEIAREWGGPVTVKTVVLGSADDPYSHVIAGHTLSPGQTTGAIATITDWARGL